MPVWNGQDVSACRLLDIVEEGEERDLWPVVDTFAVDAATTVGLLPHENVDRVQLFYRWSLLPEVPEYECHASHDPTNLLPVAFPWKPAILYGTIDVAVSIGGLHVLDLPGVEIVEGVQMSQGVERALARGPEKKCRHCRSLGQIRDPDAPSVAGHRWSPESQDLVHPEHRGVLRAHLLPTFLVSRTGRLHRS